MAVGGGSVIDGTKFIAAACYYEGDPWDILTSNRVAAEVIPLGTVLTLPATGSEMNCGAVISKADFPDKLGFKHPAVYPRFSILDPMVTFSLPRKQIANGVVDALIHVIEQYLTYPVGATLQDRMAEGIMLTIIEEAQKILANAEDYQARANFMWAATWALNYFIAAGVPEDWATHALSHEITARFGLDHGEALAVVLPSLLNVKKEQKKTKLLQFGERIWGIKEGPSDDRMDQIITRLEVFFNGLGIKTKLGAYGITTEAIPILVDQLKKHGRIALGEHGDIDLEQSERIYRGCF